MKGNLYKFTITHLEDSKGRTVETRPIVFEVRNHEDIFQIIKMMKGKAELDSEDATVFAVGLKLVSGVIMKNREKEMFSQFKPHFIEFMKELKKV